MNVLILNSGRIPKEMRNLFGSLPSGMIPVNGKPSLMRMLDSLFSFGIDKPIMTVGFQKESVSEVVDRFYSNRMGIRLVETDCKKRPGHSIIKALTFLDNSKSTLILLGDNLITDSLMNEITSRISEGNSFVLSSKDFENPEDWCVVSKDSKCRITGFFDKKPSQRDGMEALIGVYYLKDTKLLSNCCKAMDDVEISQILEKYMQHDSIHAFETGNWLDIGHIKKYYSSKKKILQSRRFNRLVYDEKYNTLTKYSKDREKLLKEINWYLRIPEKLKSFTPKIINFSVTEPSITMEYVGYPTVAELFVFSNFDMHMWKSIIDKLFSTLLIFNEYQGIVDIEDYEKMYIGKTEQRLRELSSNPSFSELLSSETITINNKPYRNFSQIKDDVYLLLGNIFSEDDNSVIHGDFCFSNIMLDPTSNAIKMFDPRGRWGKHDIYGDIKYDAAKLSHSICGKYDFIISGLFDLKEISGSEYEFRIFTEQIHDKVEDYFLSVLRKKWDPKIIRAIEGLLFISMIPLHSEDEKRQKAFYLNAIKILNECVC